VKYRGGYRRISLIPAGWRNGWRKKPSLLACTCNSGFLAESSAGYAKRASPLWRS